MDKAVGNTVGRRTLAKITLRLIPFMFVLYAVAFLDRVNVDFAALQMNEDLRPLAAALRVIPRARRRASVTTSSSVL